MINTYKLNVEQAKWAYIPTSLQCAAEGHKTASPKIVCDQRPSSGLLNNPSSSYHSKLAILVTTGKRAFRRTLHCFCNQVPKIAVTSLQFCTVQLKNVLPTVHRNADTALHPISKSNPTHCNYENFRANPSLSNATHGHDCCNVAML